MAKAHFTNKAIKDLEAIWKYTVKTWSENQAEIYYGLLIDFCQSLTRIFQLSSKFLALPYVTHIT
jgi:toxin ParE1/3/4